MPSRRRNYKEPPRMLRQQALDQVTAVPYHRATTHRQLRPPDRDVFWSPEWNTPLHKVALSIDASKCNHAIQTSVRERRPLIRQAYTPAPHPGMRTGQRNYKASLVDSSAMRLGSIRCLLTNRPLAPGAEIYHSAGAYAFNQTPNINQEQDITFGEVVVGVDLLDTEVNDIIRHIPDIVNACRAPDHGWSFDLFTGNPAYDVWASIAGPAMISPGYNSAISGSMNTSVATLEEMASIALMCPRAAPQHKLVPAKVSFEAMVADHCSDYIPLIFPDAEEQELSWPPKPIWYDCHIEHLLPGARVRFNKDSGFEFARSP